MKLPLPFRLCLGAVLAALFSASPAFARWRAPRSAPPPPILRPNRPPARPAARPPAKPAQRQEPHLQQWMDNHKNLSLPDQQRAFENEPGFHDLPPQVQQRYRDELVRLHNMPPQQRDRRLEQNEILERMKPPQRQQYYAAVQNFASLPPDRRRLMARAVVDIRQLPLEQRQSVINSDRFRTMFSDGERSTLTNLLAVEPYPPVTGAPEGP